MNNKKNPTKDLNQKRGLYFVIGLIFLLVLIYTALECKTPYDNGGYDIDETIENVQQPSDSSVILKTTAINNDTVSD